VPLTLADGSDSGLTLSLHSVPGKPPLHTPGLPLSEEDNVALRIVDRRTRGVLVYASSVRGYAPVLETLTAGASALFFDGTFFSSEELVALGASDRRAEDMSHWPIGGPEGSLQFLKQLDVPRRIYIHINNSNPMLLEGSPERAKVEAERVEIARDGMELEL
jgi:pyrroloquinoline quinone biosynthesis protein B